MSNLYIAGLQSRLSPSWWKLLKSLQMLILANDTFVPTSIQNQNLMSHQDGFGNHGPEATGLTKSDESDHGMQKKSENVAHAPDGIKLKKLKNSIGLWNSPTTGLNLRQFL
jgi:hypothetical protein